MCHCWAASSQKCASEGAQQGFKDLLTMEGLALSVTWCTRKKQKAREQRGSCEIFLELLLKMPPARWEGQTKQLKNVSLSSKFLNALDVGSGNGSVTQALGVCNKHPATGMSTIPFLKYGLISCLCWRRKFEFSDKRRIRNGESWEGRDVVIFDMLSVLTANIFTMKDAYVRGLRWHKYKRGDGGRRVLSAHCMFMHIKEHQHKLTVNWGCEESPFNSSWHQTNRHRGKIWIKAVRKAIESFSNILQKMDRLPLIVVGHWEQKI